jgi:hypothetical protein
MQAMEAGNPNAPVIHVRGVRHSTFAVATKFHHGIHAEYLLKIEECDIMKASPR